MKNLFVCQTRYLSDMEPLDEVISAYCKVNGKELLLTSFGDLMLMDLLGTSVQRPAKHSLNHVVREFISCSAFGRCNANASFTLLLFESACKCIICAISEMTYLLLLLQLKRGTRTHVVIRKATCHPSHFTTWIFSNVPITSTISIIAHGVAHHEAPALFDARSTQANVLLACSVDATPFITVRHCGTVCMKTFSFDSFPRIRVCSTISALL